MKQVITIAGIENYSEDWEKLYYSGRIFLIKGSRIYQLHYSNAQKCFYASVIYRIPNKGQKFTSRGRFFTFTADEVNNLLGFNFVK